MFNVFYFPEFLLTKNDEKQVQLYAVKRNQFL